MWFLRNWRELVGWVVIGGFTYYYANTFGHGYLLEEYGFPFFAPVDIVLLLVILVWLRVNKR